ncbi:predicted glycosyltransferase [Corynebacterium kutscheri]|uniref:Glycosyltransferase n=1 Tax=Corynebacterium kutscheri TaxID=35755 RepID=A0A0F6TEU9_9CORY|nr:glycosyltransferase family 4 protein [Corynebacterium kutscheri]AKE42111.1 glycosyltransferase [Corynebacterium kutscheri]VEH05959.1 predicted glycosyltransferase [Corynebacterium kutscheri]VEH10454.1 predicted glycosyltransferase [Corynebacterium kutscheri]VEH81848.1 predicted glycosyltransferase [Corynebacterium kutscheri]
MKILLLCWRDSTHPQGGGSERYLERVASYLVKSGHEVIYRTSSFTDSPYRSYRDGIWFSRRGGKFGVYMHAALAMLAGRVGLGIARNVDVVVDTQNGIPFFARFFSGRPTILLTHHCHREQWPVAGPFLSRLGWFLESVVSPFVHRGMSYVTVSAPSKEELVELGVREADISIIRNGVDPIPSFVPILPNDQRIHLVTLSRLVPHKHIEDAIDVIEDLDVVLDVIGSGWWEDELRAYAQRKGVSGKVIFHGQVTEDYKHALLDQAALHLMPSRKEGWGLAVIEAAQHGVPTIGYTQSGGLRDSIEDNETGVLVDTPQELSQAVKTLLDDASYRKKLGERAKLKAHSYSWEETGKQFEALLKELLTNTHSASS